MSKTMLYRQIHPNFVKYNDVVSAAFRPPPNDPFRLSVYDGEQITPKGAWEHYTKQLESEGVMGFTVSECNSRNLHVIFDRMPYKEHAFVNFTGYNKKEIRSASRYLKRMARARGWLFRSDGLEI